MWNIFKIAKPVQLPQLNPSTISLTGRKLHITPLIFPHFHEGPKSKPSWQRPTVPPEVHIISHAEQRHHICITPCGSNARPAEPLHGCFTFHPKTFITSNDWNWSPACLTLVTNTLEVLQRVVCHITRNVESKFTHFHSWGTKQQKEKKQLNVVPYVAGSSEKLRRNLNVHFKLSNTETKSSQG